MTRREDMEKRAYDYVGEWWSSPNISIIDKLHVGDLLFILFELGIYYE